jgi:hypothetical protein
VNEGDRRFLPCIDGLVGSPFHFGGRGGVSKRVTESVSILSMIGWFVLRMDWLKLTTCNSENPRGQMSSHSRKGGLAYLKRAKLTRNGGHTSFAKLMTLSMLGDFRFRQPLIFLEFNKALRLIGASRDP